MLSRETDGEAQVQACYSGAEALEIMKEQRMDVLMTDINMPDFSGLELHNRMTALQPDCRVIYLTGYSEFEYARQALDQHAFAYVLKRAKALLSGSRIPLQEVALKTGFTSTNYFCRWFHKEMHMTPKVYRDKEYSPS